MKTYKWLPTESAPLSYPVRIQKGYFVFSNSSRQQIPCAAIARTGWGNKGSVHLIGDSEKPVPTKLELLWTSFVECTHYKGEWSLPSDKIKTYFNEGYTLKNDKKSTYSKIIVGMAPGGSVVLWLSGDGGARQVEVAHFKAKKIVQLLPEHLPNHDNISKQDYFNSGIEKLTVQQKDLIKLNGIKTELWDKYRKKYCWNTTLFAPKGTKAALNYCTIKMYNGEREKSYDPLKLKDRAVPYLIEFKHQINNTFYIVQCMFNETELFKAIETLLSDTKDDTFEIYIKPTKYHEKLKVKLINSSKEIVLENCEYNYYTL